MSYFMDLESVGGRRESSFTALFQSNSGRSSGYADPSIEDLADEDEDEDLEDERANSMQNQIDPLEEEAPMVDPPGEDDDEFEDGEIDEEEEDEPIHR